MDKEQFDHIETLFRQAAMNVSPPANEEAWKKMEALLDREFHKKRRRAIIWWWPVILFFLFLGGMMFYYNHSQPVNNRNGVSGTSPDSFPVDRTKSRHERSGLQQRNQQQNIPATSDHQRMLTHPQHQSEPSVTGKQSLQNADDPAIAGISKSFNVSKAPLRKAKKSHITLQSVSGGIVRNFVQETNSDQSGNDHFPAKSIKAKLTLPELISESVLQSDTIHNVYPDKKISPVNKPLLNSVTNISHTSIQIKRERRFYFVASISPDASAVGRIHFNKFNSRLGLGAGYQLTKKLSLQTGLYAGRMIYTAGDGDYTIKPGSYISKIIRINADCYFYNVPLSLRYNALQSKRYDLYAVGGLSSFWSKNETYDYHFLNRNGMYRNMVSTYKNNKNLFSTINLSLGIERSLTKVLYVQAEPYLLVPVSGVGEGKVKIQSAGLQFGIRYKPLRK